MVTRVAAGLIRLVDFLSLFRYDVECPTTTAVWNSHNVNQSKGLLEDFVIT
jgi:hypothetical protein